MLIDHLKKQFIDLLFLIYTLIYIITKMILYISFIFIQIYLFIKDFRAKDVISLKDVAVDFPLITFTYPSANAIEIMQM